MTPDRTLDPEAFRSLISMQGQVIRYWRALPCPCSDPQNGTFSRTCPYHDKYGFIYSEITLSPSVRAYIYSSKSSINDPQLGWIKIATTMVETMTDEIFLDRGDKLLSVNAQLVQRETRARAATGNDDLSQLFVFALDALVVQGGTTYVQGTDYVLVKNVTTGASSINWIGAAPAAGVVYSVIYRYAPIYWVIGQTMNQPRPSATGVPLVLRSELSMKHPSEAG